jgi:hypothetical protein
MPYCLMKRFLLSSFVNLPYAGKSLPEKPMYATMSTLSWECEARMLIVMIR